MFLYFRCMKKIILLIGGIILFHNSLWAQVSDNFSDNNFTSNPSWQGDVAKFEVNTASQLHLNAPAATDTAYLSTTNNRIDTAEWQFWMKMDFSPSTSNQLRVYLCSDQSDLTSPLLNGYYLQMGTLGSLDSIQLYKQNGPLITYLGGGLPGHVAATTNTLRIKVRRDQFGNWTVWSDTLGGHNFQVEMTATDNSITTTAHFGFVCLYTSTRSDKFYFDDVYIGGYQFDITPPSILSATIVGPNALDVLFDEDVSLSSSQTTANYNVTTLGSPIVALRDAANNALVHLTFFNSFQSASYTITVNGVQDLSLNILNGGVFTFSNYVPAVNDIIINEIFADPTPSIGLPVYEYVELYNRSPVAIDLKNWSFSDSSSSQTFPSSIILKPDSFLIVCAASLVSNFTPFGTVYGLGSLPSLNNTGDVLSLKNQAGTVINSVAYTDSWYGDNVKKSGGWSLELIDPSNPCGGANNWKASSDPSGGTPGKVNSVFGSNPDLIAPQLIRAVILTNQSVRLYFSESVDGGLASSVANYQVNNSLGQPTAAYVVPPQYNSVDLLFSNTILPKTIYTITAENIKDCTGNEIGASNSARFGIAEPAIPGDILINEILFNPRSGSYDFVELYSTSDKIIDLGKMLLASRSSDRQIDVAYNPAPASGYLFFPNSYLVLTENIADIKANYQCPDDALFLEMATLPGFNDDEDYVVLMNQSTEIIDELHYFDTWHFPLLNNKEGVSLERIRFNDSTQSPSNWHSAASAVGFATPGYKNSQSLTDDNTTGELTLTPEVFSPDNDGVDDILTINYKLDMPGYTAKVEVYDASGRLIKSIAKNETLPQEGHFTWDGTDNTRSKLSYGIYIIYAEMFQINGKVKRCKKDCVLAGKL